ncbi:MAG: spore cortex-lytic protein [Oscillospiraceae bacterium]|nr:spore cortex-lytic protein [Oscillospiraceae bacterium]
MPSVGYIQVHAYSSFAELPLKDVAISVTTADNTILAMRLTDRSGRITPIEVPVPELAESLAPGNVAPFTSVTLRARIPGYEQIQVDDLQVFADTVTVQNLEMIPLSELPSLWSKSETFLTPPQNL